MKTPRKSLSKSGRSSDSSSANHDSLSFGKLSERVIFDFLISRMQTTLSQMALHLNMPASTLSRVLAELEHRQMVVRRIIRSGKRGRPEVAFQVRAPGRMVVCQFDGSQLSAAVFDAELHCQALERVHLIRVESPQEAAKQIQTLLDRLLSKVNMKPKDIGTLGLSLNTVWTGHNTLGSSVLPWANESVGGVFASELGMPVELVVPFAPKAMAEYHALPEPFPNSMAYFLVDDGVSAHCIVRGRALRGSSSLAGELGHVTIDPAGPLCGCGRRGCLEALCSGPALRRQLLESLRQNSSGSTLSAGQLEEATPRRVIQLMWESWQSGDPLVRRILDRTFEHLGWALSVVINLMDPQLVTIGGYVLEDKEPWIKEIKDRSVKGTLHGANRQVQIQPGQAKLEDELRVVAAWSAYRPFLDTTG
ncbi:MAG: ROK family protein [Phycisphaeraceae bacterium]|nr:ROK family protein [Phycisphaeraceae bacterium]